MELCSRLLFSWMCQRLTAAGKGVGVVGTVVKLLKAAAEHRPGGELRKILVTKTIQHTETNHSKLTSGSHLTARLGLLQKAQVAYHGHRRLEAPEEQLQMMADGVW